MLSEWFKSIGENGLKVPLAYDAANKQPSITLLFAWFANALALLSLIYLHIAGDKLVATTATIIYAVISTVLYMIRKLHKAKFDLENKAFELESEEEEKK